MKIRGVSKLDYWWNLSIVRRRGSFISLFSLALAFGWLAGLSMGMGFATRVINAHHSNLPHRPDIYDYGQEQTETSLETRR